MFQIAVVLLAPGRIFTKFVSRNSFIFSVFASISLDGIRLNWKKKKIKVPWILFSGELFMYNTDLVLVPDLYYTVFLARIRLTIFEPVRFTESELEV